MDKPFDKYFYYSESVQSPAADVVFLDSLYRELRGGKSGPAAFREDFCGTFAMCCEWAKMGPKRIAYGVDLDPEPLAYGWETYYSKLTKSQKERVQIIQHDVLGPKMPKADLICAMNFSYFIFKQRAQLKKYFQNCLRTLNDKGILVLDCFGGSKCQEPNEEVSEHGDPGFDYYWDQDTFDPLTNEGMFYIHFKRKGEKKRTKVFTYDWRMWSPAELKDLMLEVGFKDVKFYWEGVTEDGDGDGDYQLAEKGEECEAWVTYIVGMK